MTLKNKFIKWIKKKPTNNEIFIVLILILVGKWSMPSMLLMMTPIYVGTQGIELTDAQVLNITQGLVNNLIPSINSLNDVGLNLQGSVGGYFVGITLGIIPYLVLTWVIIIIIVFIRVTIGYFYTKWKSTKNP